jgi:hypothetical protein
MTPTLLLQTILVAVISAIVTSIIPMHYSLKSFYKNRVWEKKADEYQRLIRALAEEQNRLEKWEEHANVERCQAEGTPLTQKDKEKLWEEGKAHVEAMRETAMAGSFFISEEAITKLQGLLNGMEKIKYEKEMDGCEKEIKLIKKTITEIRMAAINDLELNKWK